MIYMANYEMLSLFTDVMAVELDRCEKMRDEWDFDGIQEWLQDYEDGVIHEVVIPLVPYQYTDMAHQMLRGEYRRMKQYKDEIIDTMMELELFFD